MLSRSSVSLLTERRKEQRSKHGWNKNEEILQRAVVRFYRDAVDVSQAVQHEARARGQRDDNRDALSQS